MIDVIAYDRDRKAEIIELVNLALGPRPDFVRDVPYWTWKHEQNPFGESIVLLAESEGRLAGVRAFLRWDLNVDGALVSAACPVDTVTHPDFQRRGIFRQLTLAACDHARTAGVQLLFNTPNANSLPGYLKMGWRHAGELPISARMIRPLRSIADAVRWRLEKRPAQPSLTVEELFHDTPQFARDWFTEESRTADLLQSQPGSVASFQTARTLAFLKWRYAGHPHLPYFTEADGNGERLDGLLFYRANRRFGLIELRVTDVLLRDGAYDIYRSMIDRLVRRTRAHYVISHFPPTDGFTSLRRAGKLRPVPRKSVALAVRSLTDSLPLEPVGMQHWNLAFGDFEGL